MWAVENGVTGGVSTDCFGVGKPGGELPVDIFRLGEDYYPTEEILWNRGAARNAADREAQ